MASGISMLVFIKDTRIPGEQGKYAGKSGYPGIFIPIARCPVALSPVD
jgi:hypothetical protein